MLVFKKKTQGKSRRVCLLIKKMGDFIEPGTHRSTIIKVKNETLLKK